MEKLYIWLKALWIGATMTVPGVSGGTMAVLTGIYEPLLEAVNGLRKQPGKYIPFLVRFVCGAGIGFLLFAKGITFLLDNGETGVGIRLLFCGIVAGGIPLLVEKSGVKKVSVRYLFCMLLGTALVLLLAMIPKGTFDAGRGIANLFLLFAGGFLIAVALILPGISATHMLYILGLYETVLMHAYALEILPLLPLLAGGLCGTFLITGFIERVLHKYPAEVYLIIIGFVAGSMITLFPQGGTDDWMLGGILALAGFLVMYFLGKQVN